MLSENEWILVISMSLVIAEKWRRNWELQGQTREYKY